MQRLKKGVVKSKFIVELTTCVENKEPVIEQMYSYTIAGDKTILYRDDMIFASKYEAIESLVEFYTDAKMPQITGQTLKVGDFTYVSIWSDEPEFNGKRGCIVPVKITKLIYGRVPNDSTADFYYAAVKPLDDRCKAMLKDKHVMLRSLEPVTIDDAIKEIIKIIE